MTITLPIPILIPGHRSYDKYLAERWNLGVSLGGSIATSSGKVTMTIANANAGLITYPDIQAVDNAGGTIEGMPGYLEISKNAINASVSEGLPQRMRDETAARSWREYHTGNHELREDAEGNFWLGANSTGQSLTGAELVLAHRAYGVNFRMAEEYQAAFPDPQL